MKFEPRVRVGLNRDVSLPSTWWNWQLLKLNSCCFFFAVVNLVTCLNRVKWAGWLFINVFAVFDDILSHGMLPEGRKNFLETNRKIWNFSFKSVPKFHYNKE